MRGHGFTVPQGGIEQRDLAQVKNQVVSCCERAVPFLMFYDGQDMTVTIADAQESVELLAAFAGFKVLP